MTDNNAEGDNLLRGTVENPSDIRDLVVSTETYTKFFLR